MSEEPLAAEPTAEERAARAEQALQEALAERNRLWAELQRQRSAEEDLMFWRSRVEDIERSRWWRMTAPFRLAKRVLADPPGTMEVLAFQLRRRRRRS
jgi:hypothetical protein